MLATFYLWGMKQVVPKHIKESTQDKKSRIKEPHKPKVKRKHPQYGTSKLEEDFARNFLDKLGVKYIYQFEAKDIGRFYDFFLPEHNIIVECDGDFFHYNKDTQGDKEPSRMQKKNMRVDEYKNKWALLHGYPLIRIWESDIRKHPKEVMDRLKERLYLAEEKNRKKGRNLGKKMQ